MPKSHLTILLAITAFAFIDLSCKKGGTNNGNATNGITIFSVSQARQRTASTFEFTVQLEKPSSSETSVSFTTAPGTAVDITDFQPISGTLTIPANQQLGSIKVQVTGDSVRKENQLFYVKLSNPKNGMIKNPEATGTIININNTYLPVDNAGYSTPSTYPGYTLAWNDEFDGNAVNNTWWTFEQGAGGWGNNELQYYTNTTENAFVSNGKLIIEARQQAFGGSNYTSARMITKNKKVFKYGRIDMRAKMPKGKGIWPALWMLGNNIDAVNWPACGEIDILEYLGHETNKIYGTMHWGANTSSHAMKGSNYTLPGSSFDLQFHVYSIIWKQDSIKVLVDDIEFFSFAKSDVGAAAYPFNDNFFFIFNVAVGGNWPGAPDATTVFPQRLIVDYVRVFQ